MVNLGALLLAQKVPGRTGRAPVPAGGVPLRGCPRIPLHRQPTANN